MVIGPGVSAGQRLLFCDACSGSIVPPTSAVLFGGKTFCPSCAPPEARRGDHACAACGRQGADNPWGKAFSLETVWLCSACYDKWVSPVTAWSGRWFAGAAFMGVGFVAVLVGAIGDEVYRVGRVMSVPWVAVGLALILVGVGIRPSYRRPPDPPGTRQEEKPPRETP